MARGHHTHFGGDDDGTRPTRAKPHTRTGARKRPRTRHTRTHHTHTENVQSYSLKFDSPLEGVAHFSDAQGGTAWHPHTTPSRLVHTWALSGGLREERKERENGADH